MGRPGYETFDHTADLGLHLYGRDLHELFSVGAAAMLELLAEPGAAEPLQSRRLELAAESSEALLRAWLAEILYYLNTERWLTARVKIDSFSPTALSATLEGEPLDLARHCLGPEVKAVTWHRLRIEPDEASPWLRATLILDL